MIDPVGFTLVEGLYYLIVFLLLTLIVVLQQVNQVALLEKTTHPVFLSRVLKHPVAFKNSILKLAYVQIAVFEPFLAESVQLGIRKVAPLNYFQLELVLVPMCIRIVTAVAASEYNRKSEPIHQSVFLEADCQFVSIFLHLYVGYLLNIVLQGSGMHSAYQKISFPQIKNSIEDCEIRFLALINHTSFLERCVDNSLCYVV